MAALPSAEELERLTLRALAAYAARCARRAARELRGIIDDEIIDAPLQIIEKFVSTPIVNDSDSVAICQVAAIVAGKMEGVPPGKRVAALCLVKLEAVVGGVHYGIKSLQNPKHVKWYRARLERGIKSATEIANWAIPSEGPTEEAIDAACNDYELLLKIGGSHQDVVLGEPIDLSKLPD